MSLLLDALKKAAEQKAQKSKSGAPVESGSDETVLDAGADQAAPAETGLGTGVRDDETEFEHSELHARLERSSVVRGAGDETGLDLPDSTDARFEQARTAVPGGDETGLDLPDATEARIEPVQSVSPGGDETGLDLPDSTDARFEQARTAVPGGDETGLDLPDATEARIEPVQPVSPGGDETGLDLPDPTDARFEPVQPVSPGGDETGLDLPDSTDARFEPVQTVSSGADETGLDLPDSTNLGFEPAASESPGGDETGLDIEPEEPADFNPSDQMSTGDDETIVFESEDESDFEVMHDSTDYQILTSDDETDMSQLGDREDLTGIGGEPADSVVADAAGGTDETDLSQLDDDPDELTGVGEGGVSEDESITVVADEAEPESDLQDLAGAELPDETDISQSQADDESIPPAVVTADETDLSQPLQLQDRGEDPERAGDADVTDFREPARSAAEVEPADASLLSAGATENEDVDEDDAITTPAPGRDIIDEDLSLLLLEPDPTNPGLAAQAATAEPRVPVVPPPAASGVDELGLVDTTQTRTGGEPTATESVTLTNPAAATAYSDQTRTVQAGQGSAARDDATSTRTYAPDNYDRTLMKLPSDDASKLFAGMKSDSDVVMTPDYAKKVFRSKTSAQRAQHYKAYVGIATVIVLSISVFGYFQYKDESFEIDASLQPLKRDPMPGAIKLPKPVETSLFAESDNQTTARTIEIIETAETTDAAGTAETTDTTETAGATETADATEPAETEESVSAPIRAAAETESGVISETVTATETVAPQPEEVEQEAAPQREVVQAGSDAAPEVAAPQAAAQEPEQVAGLASALQDQPDIDLPSQNTDNMQISSSSRYRDSDVWLRDAYTAYRAGDDPRALQLYNQVLEAEPGNRNARLARAAIYMQNGDANAAVADYQALLEANPKDSMAMSSLLAVANYSPQEVESQLKLMIYDEPDSPHLNFALGNAYGAQNRWKEAQRHYFTALQTNPQDPNYAYNLAISLEHISQPASAATFYQRALDNFENGLATFNRDIVSQRLEVLGNL